MRSSLAPGSGLEATPSRCWGGAEGQAGSGVGIRRGKRGPAGWRPAGKTFLHCSPPQDGYMLPPQGDERGQRSPAQMMKMHNLRSLKVQEIQKPLQSQGAISNYVSRANINMQSNPGTAPFGPWPPPLAAPRGARLVGTGLVGGGLGCSHGSFRGGSEGWWHSPPGPSVHGILQARILEWVAMPFSRGIFPTQGSNQGPLHCR